MKKLAIVIFILLQSVANAQGFRVRHYLQGTLNNVTKAVFETNAGNYFAGGIIVDSVNGVYTNRLCIMGLNSQGQIQWVKKYGNANLIYLDNIFISRMFYKRGNDIYFTCGVLDSTNKYSGVLVKFNFNGDTLWQKVYRDSDAVVPQQLVKSTDGGLLITGNFQNASYSKCMVIKTDINGNELWRRKIGKVSPNVQDGKAIVQDSSTKKIAIVGYQFYNGYNNYDNLVITDSLGLNASRLQFTGTGGNLFDLIQTKDKKFVAVGTKFYPQSFAGFNLQRSFAVKFDINNPTVPIWKIDGFDALSLSNGFNAVKEMGNGNLLLAGVLDTLRVQSKPENDLIRLTKISPTGSVVSNSYYNYKINDSIKDNLLTMMDFDFTSDGGIVGAIEVVNAPNPNPFFFVKWDSTGCDTSLAYCQMVAAGIDKHYFDHLQLTVYPNPASDVVYLSSAADLAGCTLNISDVAGRCVKTLPLKNSSQQAVDVSDLKSGVYLLTVIQNGRAKTISRLVKD